MSEKIIDSFYVRQLDILDEKKRQPGQKRKAVIRRRICLKNSKNSQ